MIAQTTSLRLRLVGTLGAFFLVSMVALYFAALAYARLAADKSYDRLLSGSALSIAETISITDGQVAVDIPFASLDMLSAAPDDRVFYRVVGPDQRTITGYSDLPKLPATRRGSVDVGNAGQFFDAPYRGEQVRFVSLGRLIAQPGMKGFVFVQVGQTRRARDGLARELVFGSLAPILLLGIFAVAIIWIGIDRALRPLGRLGAELAERQPQDLNPVETAVPLEVVPVVQAINGFMRRLRENVAALRTFIADAAHQIRTPLAAIQAQAQLAEGGDVEEVRASLAAVSRNAAKLTRLVNQMLSDATIQHRSEVRVFKEFDLIATIRQSLREAVPLTDDSDVRFTTSLRTAPLIGDRLMMGEVVKNLIQNALTHGRGDHSEVLIELTEANGEYRLAVMDRGPGIPPSDRDQAFERFARGNSGQPGAGLGLAIVRQAVESHNGDVNLEGRPGGGLVVVITLPGKGA